MGHDKNEELREEHEHQEEHRQERRDQTFEAGSGAVDDEGSQDRRRQDGVSDLS
ncbi:MULTISPECIES: hypothetical protein [unclassified Pseudoclavibacter]|uniref:hypothetical protein n=1 Tax=unclassified Pseudoclavibacter TaxID=2615177 RepID=UPI001BA59DF2|nr:hypothetical protein [Pseudoclavibacter sp. Marseille-Q4354]MBS3177414.1 hypothetical protein [Pseudoclavibacter sp. Marseille-Q4354]